MIIRVLLLVLSTVPLFVGATPWGNVSNHSDCSAVYPSLLIPISTVSIMGSSHNSSRFSVYHNATSAVRGDTLIQFSIPNSTFGCQLEFNFTGGFKNLANDSESNQLDIWTTDRAIQSDQNWSNAPGRAALFATAVFRDGISRVMMSTCESKPVLSFRLCMASGADVGNVSFFQTSQSGIKVTRSCR